MKRNPGCYSGGEGSFIWLKLWSLRNLFPAFAAIEVCYGLKPLPCGNTGLFRPKLLPCGNTGLFRPEAFALRQYSSLTVEAFALAKLLSVMPSFV